VWKDGSLEMEKNKKVMDVAGGRDKQHGNIGFWKRHNGINQQFDLIYADDMPEVPRKGELNEDFGLFV